jgi:hypothetical protein
VAVANRLRAARGDRGQRAAPPWARGRHLAAPDRGAAPRGIAWNGRFPSSSVTRTLPDLAARYEPAALGRALAEAEFQHDVRPDDLVHMLRRGHPGSARLRAALEAQAPWDPMHQHASPLVRFGGSPGSNPGAGCAAHPACLR